MNIGLVQVVSFVVLVACMMGAKRGVLWFSVWWSRALFAAVAVLVASVFVVFGALVSFGKPSSGYLWMIQSPWIATGAGVFMGLASAALDLLGWRTMSDRVKAWGAAGAKVGDKNN